MHGRSGRDTARVRPYILVGGIDGVPRQIIGFIPNFSSLLSSSLLSSGPGPIFLKEALVILNVQCNGSMHSRLEIPLDIFYSVRRVLLPLELYLAR